MMALSMVHGPSESPATLAFRNPDALFALYQRFEKGWEDCQEIGFSRERPEGFPPLFRSAFEFRRWVKSAADDEVLDAQRKWARKAAELECELVAMPLPPVDGRAAMQTVLEQPPVPVPGYPRLWTEPQEQPGEAAA